MKRIITSLLLGTAALPGFAGQVFAADGGNIETVVVTAEKRAEEAKNVPISMNVVGQDELNKLNLRSYADLMAQVPGLSVSEGLGSSHPVLTLRGINAGGDGSTVGTYLDETPYGSSNALANGTDTAPNLDTFDMQRVEVLRGPQGTLYGAGTEGGLIKFVTNAPSTAGFESAFELEGTNVDNGGFGGAIRGMANIALSDDLAVRVVGFDSHTSGFIDDPGLGRQHVNDVTSFGGRASALWTPNSKLSVRLNVMQQQLDTGGSNDEDVVVVNGKITPLFGDYEQERAFATPAGVRYYLYNATINYDMGFASVVSSTSFTDLRDFTFADDTAVLGAGVQGFLRQGKFIQEVRLQSNPGPSPFDWMVGFYFANEHDGLHQDVVTSFHGTSFESLDLNSRYVEKTGFANATYRVTSSFELGAGLRYASDSQDSGEFITLPPFGRVGGGPSEDSKLTWSVDGRYHFDDQSMVYARVATGWRPGGPNVLPPNAPPGTPRTYNPDSLTNYEIGIKGNSANNTLSFDADIFDIQWNDIQLLETVNNFNINGNGGKAESKGAEANLTWVPVEQLTLNFNSAYTDAELTTDAKAVDGKKGDPLPNAPKWTVTLNGDYQFSPIGNFTPYLGASWHYVGNSGWGFSAGTPEGRLPSYNTFDLRVGVDWEKWSLELYGRNLSSAKGFTAFTPASGSAASLNAATASVITPRVVGLVLRAKF